MFKVHCLDTRVGYGDGIFCCDVVNVGDLDTGITYHVKASYVEPGHDSNVMFRSKTVVHSTAALPCGQALNEYFEYDIFPPEDGGWENLQGDLLFTVYSNSNSFSGQVLVALNSLLDGERIKGGTQKVRSESYNLVGRTGESVGGFLRLKMHMELPPGEPLSPKMESKSVVESSTKLKIVHSQPKLTKKKNPRIKLSEQVVERKKRERLSRQQEIRRENRKIYGRISNASGRDIIIEATCKARTFVSSSKGSANELLDLSSQIDEYQKLITRLEHEIPVLNATIAREETIARKKEVKVSINRSTKVLTSNVANKNFKSSPLFEEKKRDLLSRFKRYDKTSAQFRQLEAALQDATIKNAESELELENVNAAIKIALQRKSQAFDRETKHTKIESDSVELQDRELKIEIRILEQTIQDMNENAEFETQLLQERVDTLLSKRKRKTEKLKDQNEINSKLQIAILSA